MALKEMNSTEESTPGVAARYSWLTPPRCSPAANTDIASNETVAYADIATNENNASPETH